MALKALKCPNCEANIQVDGDRDYGFCSYCGAQIQIKEVVEVRSAQEMESARFDKLMEDAQAYLLMGDYFRAEEGFMEMIRLYPGKAIGYERLICAITHNYTRFPIENVERINKLTKKMLAVATEEEHSEYEAVCERIKLKFAEQEFWTMPTEREREIARLEQKIKDYIFITVAAIVICIALEEPAKQSLGYSLGGVFLCLTAAFTGYKAISCKVKKDKMLEEEEEV